MAKSQLPEFRPWRELFPVHPVAELFPMMDSDQLAELSKDIVDNGLHTLPAVELLSDDDGGVVLIDGRARLDALAAAGYRFARPARMFDPKGKEVGFPYKTPEDHPDLIALVVSRHSARRHLTTEQKRSLIGKLLAARPDWSNREIAALAQVSHPTVATVRRAAEAAGTIAKVEATIGRDGRTRTVAPARKVHRGAEK
jgi:hypothetical protein